MCFDTLLLPLGPHFI